MPSSASRSVSASPDSGSPNIRTISCRYSVRPAIASFTGWLATAVRHIGWSSRGGPGSTTTVGDPGTTTPGAVPTGSITYAPSGISACLRLAALTASKSQWLKRAISGFRIAAILSSSSSSSTSSRSVKRATISTVMSSAVGPRPPLVTIRSTSCSARNRSCASMSCGRSAQIVMCASSTPSSSSLSDSHGPFRSRTRPVRTSVPVTTMPARALTPYETSPRAWLHAGAGPVGQLLRAPRAEGERDRVPAGRHLDPLAVLPQLHVALPVQRAHPLAAVGLRLVDRALEDDGRALAVVRAHVGGRGRYHPELHPLRRRRLLLLRLRGRSLCRRLGPRGLAAVPLVVAAEQPVHRQDGDHRHEHHERQQARPSSRPAA